LFCAASLIATTHPGVNFLRSTVQYGACHGWLSCIQRATRNETFATPSTTRTRYLSQFSCRVLGILLRARWL